MNNEYQHTVVYRAAGRFAGWPANYGLWCWGDEIVVGFTVGQQQYRGEHAHAADPTRPFVGMQARSLDGGLTWDVQPSPYRTPGGKAVSADEHVVEALRIGQPELLENAPADCPGGIDFTHPDFALMCARTGLEAGAVSWFYISYDRCHTWEGPFRLPDFGTPGIAARTDYLIDSGDRCTLFLTAAKANGDEGRVFCARTTDGGASIRFLAWIGDEPEGYTIMPASVRPGENHLLTAMRCSAPSAENQEPRKWIDLYASEDDGATWHYRNTPVPSAGRWGNPPAMIRLYDGRLCLVYGYRDTPAGIRARLSTDDGQTWGDEIILRADGGSHDLGYPRIAQRSDGTVVIVYYFTDSPEGERYIAATLWRP